MKKVLALITAALMAVTLTTASAAIDYSGSNKDIDIVYGEFNGYRFNGPDAPGDGVDTSLIAAVKFYIKCPDLESIEQAVVSLVYNSGTTAWVEVEHDLNDGLIVDIDVPGVVAGDYFDAALGTWNEAVWGTFSVELLDANGQVIGEGVYTSNVYAVSEEAEVAESEPEEVIEETEQETQQETEQETQQETEPVPIPETTSMIQPAKTGRSEIVTATVITGLSAWAIVSMRKKKV